MSSSELYLSNTDFSQFLRAFNFVVFGSVAGLRNHFSECRSFSCGADPLDGFLLVSCCAICFYVTVLYCCMYNVIVE